MKKPSKLTMIILPIVVSYLGLHSYDYYKLRKEKTYWLNLLEERVGKKSMKVNEDLRYVKILLTKEGKDVFYDYAKDLLKYLDYEVKELPETPGQGYMYLKDHLTDSDGLIVVGNQLFKELIEAYNHYESSLNPLKVIEESHQKPASSYRTNRWFSWLFSRQKSTNASLRESPDLVTSNDVFGSRLPILGYLPLKKDNLDRPWYAFILDHFFESHEVRRISYSAWVIADGFTELIHEHRHISNPLLPFPFITFKEHLLRSSSTEDNLKPMKVFSSDPSFSPAATLNLISS